VVTNVQNVGFEVLTAVTTNSKVFWVVMPHGLETVHVAEEHTAELATCFY
jgi:hypothetical protein